MYNNSSGSHIQRAGFHTTVFLLFTFSQPYGRSSTTTNVAQPHEHEAYAGSAGSLHLMEVQHGLQLYTRQFKEANTETYHKDLHFLQTYVLTPHGYFYSIYHYACSLMI